MRGFKISYIVLLFLVTAHFSRASTAPDPFGPQIQKHLTQLSTELDQLKKREKTISAEKKESFQSAVASLGTKLKDAGDFVGHLKNTPQKAEKEKALSLIAGLEKDLDQTESDFSEKNLGLGSLLGF